MDKIELKNLVSKISKVNLDKIELIPDNLDKNQDQQGQGIFNRIKILEIM